METAPSEPLLVGLGHDPDMLRLQRFLTRNMVAHRTADLEADDRAEHYGLTRADLPAVVLSSGRVLRNPSTWMLAYYLGMVNDELRDRVYDVAIVGAGPAGLAAAIYASSEALSTVIVEAEAPGGQAGTSSRIENYLGFPAGISGADLAHRAYLQALKFGTTVLVALDVAGISKTSPHFALRGTRTVKARSVVVATGAKYRRLSVANLGRFEGAGVYYAASPMEAALCAGGEVVVVGAANSAGQAAMFLSKKAKKVHMVIRGAGLSATMSDYLVQRIHSTKNIIRYPNTEVVALEGTSRLAVVGLSNGRRIGTSGLFSMIGAEPRTEWLRGFATLDPQGFVITDPDPMFSAGVSGLFAIGDVRRGSIKRVATAVGEGAGVVASLHNFLNPPSLQE